MNESLPELDPKFRAAVAWQAAADVIVALAGPFGECRYRNSGDAAITQTFFERNLQVFLTPDALDEDGDFAKVRSCFEYARPIEPEQALYRLVQLVNTVVNDNWEGIGRLAGRLMKKRVPSMTQLDWWFSRHEAQYFRFHADMFAAA